MHRTALVVFTFLLALGSTPAAGAERDLMRAEAGPIAMAQGIPPDLLRAVCEVESNYRPRPGDGGKSIGLCQVQPATALAVSGLDKVKGVSKAEKLKAMRMMLEDWRYNLMIAARLLKRYIDRYGSEELAMIAYNGGENHALLKYATKVKAERAKLSAPLPSTGIQLTRNDPLPLP
jgi:soluble lytic murein transglycosylase-like protein